jgi:hypothetical protein
VPEKDVEVEGSPFPERDESTGAGGPFQGQQERAAVSGGSIYINIALPLPACKMESERAW